MSKNNKKASNLGNLIPLGQKSKQRNVISSQSTTKRIKIEDFNPSTIISTIEQSMKQDNGQAETLIINFLNSIKSTLLISSKNGKILPSQCLALFSICKKFPALFMKSNVVDCMCSILSYNGKETMNTGSIIPSFKSQSGQLHSLTAIKLKQLHIAICNMLLTSFKDNVKWPSPLLKSYLDDSFSDRVWVDLPECNLFVRNIETAFPTPGIDPRLYFPLTAISEQLSDIKEMTEMKNSGESFDTDINIIDVSSINKMLSGLTTDEIIKPRFENSKLSVDSMVSACIKENVERKYIPESQMKNLLRGFCSLAGIADMRGAVITKLDNWLSQAKQQTLTLNMLTIMASSCNQNIAQNPHDMSFCVYLMLRFKYKTSKPQVQITLLECIKRISEMHPNNLRNMLLIYVNNELYGTPTITSGTTINTISTIQTSSTTHTIVNKAASVTLPAIYFRFPVESIKILGDIIHEQMCINFGDIKPVKLLLRDLCRWIKLAYTNPGGVYNSFMASGFLTDCLDLLELAQSLLSERNATESLLTRLNNVQFKQAYVENMINLLCELQMLSIIRPTVKDVFKEKNDHDKKDLDALKHHYTTLRQIRYLTCKWLKQVFRLTEAQISSERMTFYLKQVMFLNVVRNQDQTYTFDDSYSINDLWINEPDKTTLIKCLTEIPLSEKLIQTMLSLGAEKHLCYRPSEIVEMLSELIIRASACATNDIMAMNIIKGEMIINHMLTCCKYDLELEDSDPRLTVVKTLSFKSTFWKVSQAFVIMACHCPDTCGEYLWTNYPTIKNLMKIIITSNFDSSNVEEEDLETEKLLCEADSKKIIELESSLLEEGVDDTVCLDNMTSKLVNILMLNLPQGVTRQPPPEVLLSLKNINLFMKIGDRLSQCRKPDFLLEIVKSQDQSKLANRKWIIDLVKKTSEHNLECLPLLCLTEFIYHDYYDKMLNNPSNFLSSLSDTFKRLVHQIKQILACKTESIEHTSRIVAAFSNSFFIRLSNPSSFIRNVARECLYILLQPIGITISRMNCSSQFVETLKCLVNLKLFQESTIICSIVDSIKETLKYETDIDVLCCFIELFASMSFSCYNQWLVGIMDTFAILLLNRPIIANKLKFRDYDNLKLKNEIPLVSGMLAEIFLAYIAYIQHVDAIGIDDQVLVTWKDKKCPMYVNVIQCQLLLLSWGIVKSQAIQKLLDIWFIKNSKTFELPQFSSLSSSESIGHNIIIPQWLVNVAVNSGVIHILNGILNYHIKYNKDVTHNVTIALLFMPLDYISSYLKLMNNTVKEGKYLLEVWLSKINNLHSLFSIIEKLYSKVKRISLLFFDFLKANIDLSEYLITGKVNLQPNVIVQPLIKSIKNKVCTKSLKVDDHNNNDIWSGLIQSYDQEHGKGLPISSITHAINIMLYKDCKDIKSVIGDLMKLLKDSKTHSETLRLLNKSDFKLLPLLKLTFQSIDQDSFDFCIHSFNYLFNSYPHIEKLTVWKMAYNLCITHHNLIFTSIGKLSNETEGKIILMKHENYNGMVKSLVTDIMDGSDHCDSDLNKIVLRKGPKIDHLTILGIGNCSIGDESYEVIHRLLFSSHSLYQYSAYFMSDLLHQSSIESLRNILHSLLKKKALSNLNASRVLDFIDASINHPKLQFPVILLASKRYLWPQQNVEFEITEQELINLLALIINEADHLVQHNGLNSSYVNMVLTKRCHLIDITSAHPNIIKKRFAIINHYINSKVHNNPTIEKLALALYSRLPTLMFDSNSNDSLEMFFSNVDCFGTSVLHRIGKRLLTGLVSDRHDVQDIATQACKAIFCRHAKLCVQLLPYMSAISDGALDSMESWLVFKNKKRGNILYSTLLHLLEIITPFCLSSEPTVRSDLLSILSNCLRLLIRYRDQPTIFSAFATKLVNFIQKSIPFGIEYFVIENLLQISALSRIYPQFKNLIGYGENNYDRNKLLIQPSMDNEITIFCKADLDCLKNFRSELKKCQYGAGLVQTFKLLTTNDSLLITSLCLDDLRSSLSSPMDEVRKTARQYITRYLNSYPEASGQFINNCLIPNLMTSTYYWSRPFANMALTTLRLMSMLSPDIVPFCLSYYGRLFISGNNGRGNYKESVALLEEILDNISLESFMNMNININTVSNVTPNELIAAGHKRQFQASEHDNHKAKRMRFK